MKSAWPRVAFALALWLSALLVQSMGLLHGYVHPHDRHSHHAVPAQAGLSALSAEAEAGTAAHAAHPGHPAHGWLQAMFAGHHDGSAGCTLFDQLTHADVLHDLPALPLAFAAPVQPDAVHAAWHHATQVTGFLARAPPAIS
jgi:hypothetical protein